MDASGSTQTNLPPNGNGNDPDDQTDQSLGKLVNQISENASTLIREEIELAKAEVEQKVKRLAMGGVVAGVAGFFILIGLIFIFQTIAWGISDAFFPDDIWAGFLITTVLLFLLAALGGFIAYRSFQSGAPPVPDQAIEEAKLIREALEHPDVQAATEAAPEPQPEPEPQAAPAPVPPEAAQAADKAEKKRAKQAAKESKAAEKQAAKARKEAGKQAEKDKKAAEKQAKKAAKDATKEDEN